MRLGKSKILRLSVLGLLAGLTLATSAQAQWRDERHGPVWRDEPPRFDHRPFVRHEDWHFDRGRGWRFEHRPGFWSPYYVWWWTGGACRDARGAHRNCCQLPDRAIRAPG